VIERMKRMTRIERIARLASEKGFTLVELLVTTTIIGVLAAVVTVGVSGASGTAQTKANQQVYNSVQAGLDSYAAQNPLATGVPFTATVSTSDGTNYYASSGTLGGATASAGDIIVDFASSTNSFSTNFRLNNSTGTFKCVVSGATTYTLKACRN
jgi:prepilin-type N-terminal cleavage/methylation domain-containing protein